MEKMPYHPQPDSVLTVSATVPAPAALDWRKGLPTLTGALVSLREVRLSDAPSLFAALSGVEVSQFISPPPHSVDGFEKFIAWTQRQREAGLCICFAVMPKGSDNAIGLFQARSLEPAIEEIERCAGTHFDPQVVSALCDAAMDGAAFGDAAQRVAGHAQLHATGPR